MRITLLAVRRDPAGLLLLPWIGCLLWSAALLAGAVAAGALDLADLGRVQTGFQPADAQAAIALLCWLPAPVVWGWQALRVQRIRGAKLEWTIKTVALCLASGLAWMATTILGLGLLIAPGLVIFAGGVYMPAVVATGQQQLPWKAWTQSAKLLTGGRAQPMTLISGALLIVACGQMTQAALSEVAATTTAAALATPTIVTATGVLLSVMHALADEAQ